MIRRYHWGVAFLLLAGLHLLTLDAPAPRQDEETFVAWTIHGPARAAALYPRELKYLAYGEAPLALWPFFGTIIRSGIALAGPTYSLLRAPFVLLGLFNLALFAWMLRRMNVTPAVALLAVVVFGTSDLFWHTSHEIRPEMLVLSVALINLAFPLLLKNRACALSAGVLLGLSSAVHQSTVLALPPVVALMGWQLRRKVLTPSTALWWVVGVLGGGLWALTQIDPDAGIQYLRLGRGTLVRVPPLLASHGNVAEALLRGLGLWTDKWVASNPGRPWFIAAALTSCVWTLRRWPALSLGRRSIAIITVSFLASTCSLAADPKYLVYVLPWLTVMLGDAVVSTWRADWTLDASDARLFGASSMVALTGMAASSKAMSLIPVWILIFAILRRPTWAWAVALLVGFSALVLKRPVLDYFFGQVRFHGTTRWPLWVAGLSAPWIALGMIRRYAPAPIGQWLKRIAVAGMSAALIVFAIGSHRQIIDDIRRRSALQGSLSLLAGLPGPQRILGPATLRLLMPESGLVSNEPVFATRAVDPHRSVLRFKPTVVIFRDQIEQQRFKSLVERQADHTADVQGVTVPSTSEGTLHALLISWKGRK